MSVNSVDTEYANSVSSCFICWLCFLENKCSVFKVIYFCSLCVYQHYYHNQYFIAL